MTNKRGNEIVGKTSIDPEFMILINAINDGWPENIQNVPEKIKKYFNFRDELSTCNGLIFKGDRVVIPEGMHTALLKEIYGGHFGIQT